MRRIILVLAPVLAIALALSAPGIAFGHGARHHKKHHHARRARIVNLTPIGGNAGSASESGSAAESIGTVASYEKEVLTIKLTDGSTLSGKVTSDTRVICVSSTKAEGGSDHSGWGDDEHSWDGWWHHGNSCAEPSAEEGGTEPSTDRSGSGWGDSHGDCVQQNDNEEVNLEKVLVVGAIVDEAELRITPAGSAWESVVISR